ncbi:hypothetical protein PHLGIDRAFT_121381 [Phlebiopsis gigantea 11061_1 CR5-6]|uniref:Uncharacterized protein n=1 Tax=Phlebiopsis gigantea (strain 11061_1 CR5-6) TaxID=745531 RepID=A0A0C3PE46_PHLG1|nr:hypothetical protein PHLGIDRAFT_121381 [Phlebiopsis gigantea 11061_1 CR5-6]
MTHAHWLAPRTYATTRSPRPPRYCKQQAHMSAPRASTQAWPPSGGPNDHLYAPQNPAAAPPAAVGPSVEDLRLFQAWSRTQSQNPPPTWAEYQLFRQITGGAAPPPPVHGPAQHVLDPQLSIMDNFMAVDQRMELLEAELNTMKRKSRSYADGEDADDEESDEEEPRRRRGRRARNSPFILCEKGARLSPPQELVKRDLRCHVKREMQKLAGLGKNPFPFYPNEDEPLQDVPSIPSAPAEDDPGAGAPQGPAVAALPIDWTEDIDSPVNAVI